LNVEDDNDKNDSDIDIKVDELLDNLNINDKEYDEVQPVLKQESGDLNKKVTLGKRDRTGDNVEEEGDNNDDDE
jgi:hypothetical protein